MSYVHSAPGISKQAGFLQGRAVKDIVIGAEPGEHAELCLETKSVKDWFMVIRSP